MLEENEELTNDTPEQNCIQETLKNNLAAFVMTSILSYTKF
jgi:hypothetical protein